MDSPSEDIEFLLDQVEKKYISTTAATSFRTLTQTPAKDCVCNTKTETNWDEVDEILKDFKFEDTNPFGKQNNNSWTRKETKADDGPKIELKCFPIYLSGSFEASGFSEVGNERPCDKLKCVRCDFDVVSFDNYAWDPTTDYLFLRNNMPDYEKLSAKLYKKKGSRAYACQCRHLDVTKITNVNSIPQVRWVCGKHQPTKYTQLFNNKQ